jgi:putative transposase
MRLLDEEYCRHPFYGSRRLAAVLTRDNGEPINRKRVQRLMRWMGIAGVQPRRTTHRTPGAKIYPYLLRGVAVERANHVWSSDITYVPLQGGFAYLTAVMDWYSRHVLAWRLSNTLDAGFCVDALEEALAQGRPEIFNTDQGSQYTSAAFTSRLEAAKIAISMDGRGRALDNVFIERLWRSVKYEEIYLKDYERLADAQKGLQRYFAFYTHHRPHQALGYRTPYEIHKGRHGGRASPSVH